MFLTSFYYNTFLKNIQPKIQTLVLIYTGSDNRNVTLIRFKNGQQLSTEQNVDF